MRLSRTDRSIVAEWWFTVDRPMLLAVIGLIGAGLMASLAASPSVAIHLGLGPFYFVKRHITFAILASATTGLLSMMAPAQIRRISLLLLATALGLMAYILWSGPEINGARRWLVVAGQQLQPSELAKPAFVVMIAWLFAESVKRQDVPARQIAYGLYLATAALLVLQPDIGQTVLLSLVWLSLYFLSGQRLRGLVGLFAIGILAVGVAYAELPHFRSRVDRFFDHATGDTFQMDRARQAIVEGGLLGRGPGEGQVKSVLPDAQTDYVLAVIAEEYGALACLALLCLYAFVTIRPMIVVWRQNDAFLRLGVAGLGLLLGFEALINIGVNVGLLPAKGMTLPFVSYGGSSMLGMALATGMMLSLERSKLPPTRKITDLARRPSDLVEEDRLEAV
jgi:cell division protein FtsW